MKLHNGERASLPCLKKVQPRMLAQTKNHWDFAGRKDMGKSPMKQFEGSEGRLHLIRALTLQPLIHEQNLAIAVARQLRLEAVPAGANLIRQGASDTDLFLILAGGGANPGASAGKGRGRQGGGGQSGRSHNS